MQALAVINRPVDINQMRRYYPYPQLAQVFAL